MWHTGIFIFKFHYFFHLIIVTGSFIKSLSLCQLFIYILSYSPHFIYVLSYIFWSLTVLFTIIFELVISSSLMSLKSATWELWSLELSYYFDFHTSCVLMLKSVYLVCRVYLLFLQDPFLSKWLSPADMSPCRVYFQLGMLV